MTTDSAQTTRGGTHTNGEAPDHAHEIYEQLLALSNQVGAAYLEAYEKTAAGIGDFQEKLASANLPDWLDAGAAWQASTPTSEIPEPLNNAAERALEVTERLREKSKKVTLAYLNACEAAALAVADLQEEVAATSPLELVKTVGGARARLAREVTKACASTAREIVGSEIVG
jgi:hypothetical protein